MKKTEEGPTGGQEPSEPRTSRRGFLRDLVFFGAAALGATQIPENAKADSPNNSEYGEQIHVHLHAAIQAFERAKSISPIARSYFDDSIERVGRIRNEGNPLMRLILSAEACSESKRDNLSTAKTPRDVDAYIAQAEIRKRLLENGISTVQASSLPNLRWGRGQTNAVQRMVEATERILANRDEIARMTRLTNFQLQSTYGLRQLRITEEDMRRTLEHTRTRLQESHTFLRREERDEQLMRRSEETRAMHGLR